MKKKNKKLSTEERDNDLLYEILMSGGTFSDYKQTLSDMNAPQEEQEDEGLPESKDNELVGMILGMDQQEIDNEGLPHGFGGHLHQYSNSELPYIKSGQWNDGSEDFSNPFYDPIYESTEAIKRLNDPIQTLEPIKIFNVPTSEPIENLQYRQKPEISSTIGNGKLARDEWWNKYGDNVNNAFKAGELGLKWTGDIINNGFNRVNQASARTYDTMVNPVTNQTFGIGDNAYRASQWNNRNIFQNTTMRQNGAMSTGEGLLNIGKSVGEGALIGSEFGPWGTAVGAVAGLVKGGAEWGVNNYNARKNKDLNNRIGNIGDNQTAQNFSQTQRASDLLYNFGQMSQPYNIGAYGGTMKHSHGVGGYVNSHFDNFNGDLVKINKGGTHQQNPNQGVQVSVAPDGQPNLVEEGETIKEFEDGGYVFSDRIVADEDILNKHLLSKSFAGKTFANISKELDKIVNENKFDDMSRRTFEEMTRRLQQAQEDKKFQEKQEEIVEFVNGNSDYENNALKQQMQQNIQEQQEAAAQEEIAAQQAAEEQTMQDPEAQMQMQAPTEEQQSPSAYDQMMSRAQITDAADQGMFGHGGILHQNENSWARTLAKAQQLRDKYVQPDATIKVDNNGNVSTLPPSSGSESNTWRLADQAEPFIDWLNDRWHKSRQQDRNVLNNTLGEKNERRQRYIDNSVYSMRDARTGNAGFDVLVRQPITSDDPKERHDAEQMAKQYAAVNAGAGLIGVGSTSELVPITSDALTTTGTASASLVAPGTSLIVPTSYPTVAEVAASSPAWLQNALVGLGLMSTAVPAGIIAHNANEDDSNDNWGKRKNSGPQRNAKKEELLKENELKNWINKKNVDLQDRSWYVEPDGQPQDETTYEGTGLPIGLSNSDPWRIGSFNDEKKRLDKNKKGGANAEPDSSGSEGEGESESRNDRISRWLRYAPAIGTGLQALSDSLGFTNYNDYSNPNMVQRQIDAIGNVNYQPISGYRQFTPLDEEYIANQQASQMEAARRGVANNASGNASAAIAAMQNLNLGQQNNLGDLHVRTAEYNNQIQKEIAEHNMNINRINSSMSMSAQEKNQAIAAEKASLGYKVATLRQMIENANDEAKTANMNSFLTNLGNIGRENFTFNMVNDNPAYYYSIDKNGHIRYRNGFWDLGKADRDAIVADAESKLKSRQDKDKKDKEEK